jgi:hypothetical protein
VRSRAALLASALVVVALVGWGLTRRGPGATAVSTPASGPEAVSPAPAAPSPAPPGVVEPRRNVFRFGDEPRTEEPRPSGGSSRRRGVGPEPTPAPEPGPRLVGLVRRGGRLVAAFAAPDGEIELAGAGETAGGVVVVAIGDDSVRIRRPDGSEATLPLP